MTKEETYKIGAPSTRPSKFNKKPHSGPRVTGSFNRNSQNKNFQNKNHQNRDRNAQRRPFNSKNKPIKKEFNQSTKKSFRDSKDNKNRFNRNDRPFKSQNNYKNRRDRPQKNYIKKEDRNQKKQEVKPIDPAVAAAEIKKEKEKRIKHNRIIIRNLVFDVNQSHLRKLLSPFGEIVDIHIPQNPDKKGSRGFAFVEFANRNFALKAIKDLNGTTFKGRQIVLDQSVSKERFLESKINDEEKNQTLEQNKDQDNSKVKLQQSKIQNKSEEESLSDEQENESQSEVEEKKEKKEPKKYFSQKKEKSDEQILEDISSEVFIRNLPISVNQKTLHQFFRRYGQLKFAKIVINKETGLSKGSAFLKFQDSAKAKQLVEYSRDYELNLLGKNSNFKINPAINLELEGTVLKLFPVQSRNNIKEKIQGREEKDKAREQKKKEEEKKKKPIKKVKSIEKLVSYDPNDKRNLKLALLGINKVTDDMNQRDQERFMNHEREKLQKLKNPNNSVSDRRIIFKFLHKDITEQDIKKVCHEYLNETEHKLNNLTYCKLMLESLETKKSAGFAFVQFKTHEISLGFLEWIVQEPTKLMKEPYVCEFAIQDSRKMVKLENRNKNHPNKSKTNQKTKNQK